MMSMKIRWLGAILPLLLLGGRADAGPARHSGSTSGSSNLHQKKTAALGKVTWVAVPARARRRILATAEKITGKGRLALTKLRRCKTPRACRRAAQRAGATLLLSAKIEALGNTYLFRIQVHCLTGKGSSTKTETKGACEVCSAAEAGRSLGRSMVQSIDKALDTTCRQPEPRRPTATGPRQARTAPTPGQGPGGPTRVDTRPVVASQNQTARPSPSLVPAKARSNDSKKKRLAGTLKLSGWILGGVSLGSLVAGGVLLALDGKGTCSGPGECPRVYDTKAGGLATVIIGGVGLAAAATLVGLGYAWDKPAAKERISSPQTRRSWILTAAPTVGGLWVGAAGRF